ncbi:MAG: hydroxyacylglutathione hydrolase [Gallionellaceae bacterium]|nr:MAG: hydroxyacylglutathione hydrolase [Gallionellaceae bacterium]
MLTVVPIPAFNDNYIWMLHNRRHAAVIDPGDAGPVLDTLAQNALTLAAILCTHHHGDHVAGVCKLAQVYNVPVYGPRHEDVPCVSHPVGESDTVEIPELGIRLGVLDIPGHTLGHVAYTGTGNLFCGDTLFGCGCGRLFEGTAAQLFDSLQRLVSLPDETKVYCAHEYTEANIRFALACEPGNGQLHKRGDESRALRAAGLPTVPSTLALEKATNPFLRCTSPEIIRNVELQQAIHLPPGNGAAVFAALREWRNNFG